MRHARELGFDAEAIRELSGLSTRPERPCAEVDAIARRHLAEVAYGIARLTALHGEPRRTMDACGHGRVGDCRVIQVIGGHGPCAHDRGPA